MRFRDGEGEERTVPTLHCRVLHAHGPLHLSGSNLGYRILNNLCAYLPYKMASLPRMLHVFYKYKVGQVIEERNINLLCSNGTWHGSDLPVIDTLMRRPVINSRPVHWGFFKTKWHWERFISRNTSLSIKA